jgi:hypothetical protein
MKKNIYGVYFICCLNNYLDIVEEQLNVLCSSGLYSETNKLFLFITMYKTENNKTENNELDILIERYDIQQKFTLIKTPDNLYEKFAINNYKKYITDSDYYLYYFHTKGVSRINKQRNFYIGRRRILNYYTLNKYKINIELLSKYDAVGCSLSLYPKIHFSGNFWWSKSSYLNTLHDVISDNYLAVEMYILSNPKCNFVSLDQNTNIVNIQQLNNYHYKNDIEIIDNLTKNPISILKAKNLLC